MTQRIHGTRDTYGPERHHVEPLQVVIGESQRSSWGFGKHGQTTCSRERSFIWEVTPDFYWALVETEHLTMRCPLSDHAVRIFHHDWVLSDLIYSNIPLGDQEATWWQLTTLDTFYYRNNRVLSWLGPTQTQGVALPFWWLVLGSTAIGGFAAYLICWQVSLYNLTLNQGTS